ncbi:hypothetical protein CROQUDRAFT_102011 [Cronartium quercuum f. sp. fusiforme G11]|uniref:Uncharacterized protein n=1 Tax=Cronartium quercuum f. sp. fusiforme G11 TaxID=708437 RepID=A0A9P6N501_9BASI|nr:hypothetical protein CROQUDRAFT_102011 [Cronartium quercuum f. sp. fusiforme G11]
MDISELDESLDANTLRAQNAKIILKVLQSFESDSGSKCGDEDSQEGETFGTPGSLTSHW